MKKTILFIEDEAALQKTLGESLNNAGYKTIPALDGEIGLKLAKKEKPDLILLDLILPRLNGINVLEALRTDKTTCDIPVIVLTNVERMDEINRVLELGAKAYLIKADYELKEVLDKVKKVIG